MRKKRKIIGIIGVSVICVALAAVIHFGGSTSGQSADKDTSAPSAGSVTAGDVLDTAKSGDKGSALKAASELNKIKSNKEYKVALRSVLDHYYGANSNGKNDSSIKDFTSSADTRSEAIVSDYKTAAKERTTKNSRFVTGSILLSFDENASKSEIEKAAESERGEVVSVSSAAGGKKIADVKISLEYTVSRAISEYGSDEEIVSAQPNYKYRKASVPNDTYFTKQYYLSAGKGINAQQAWDEAGTAGTKVSVAVIDTGVKMSHEDLKGQIDTSLSATCSDGKVTAGKVSDKDGHGTHVAGVIAAASNNEQGIAGTATGAANNTVSIMAINASTYDWAGSVFTTNDLVASINYAADNGAKIINMSLGGPGKDDLLEEAISSVYKKGVLCICAAGNESTDMRVSPSDAPEAISVNASDETGSLTSYSNYGSDRDITAPGDSIISTWIGTKNGCSGESDDPRNKKYSYDSGTSMASPVVTGAAALLLYKDSTLTPREIKNLIYTSDNSSKFSNSYAFGKLDLGSAMNNLISSKTSPSGLVFNRTSAKLHAGDVTNIEYEVLPGNTSTCDVTFTSSNASVVTVSGEGKITCHSPGTAVVTGTVGGQTVTCNIIVSARYSSVSFSSGIYSGRGNLTKNSPLSTYKKHDDISSYMKGYVVSMSKGDRITAYERSKGFTACVKIVNKNGKCVTEKIGSDINYNSSSSATASYTAPYSGKYYIEATGDATYEGTCATGRYTIRIARVKAVKVNSLKNKKTYASIKWTKAATASGYQVYRASSKYGKYKLVAKTGASDRSAKINKAKKGKKYYYKVRAFKKYEGRYYYGQMTAPIK